MKARSHWRALLQCGASDKMREPFSELLNDATDRP